MAAENAQLASPASVASIPTNANNQDVVSMGMLAARHAARVLDNLQRLIAIELFCAAEALELRGVDGAGTGARQAYEVVRRRVRPLLEDRTVGEDVASLEQAVQNGDLVDLLKF
jgi:histidine ammonia-lyase